MFDAETLRHLYLRRFIATAAGAIGFDATAKAAQCLGAGAYGLNTFARRRAEERVRAALGPACSTDEVRRIVGGMYRHWGRFWAEALFVNRRLRESSWEECVRLSAFDRHRLSTLAAGGRGCILATGYFGNVAVLADVLGRIFRPIHVVVDVLAQPELRRWQEQLYARPHVRPIERQVAGAAIPGILAAGGAVLLIAEHERRGGRAIACDYLGCRVNAYPTIARLARWFDAPIGVVTCRREEEGFRFQMSLREVLDPRASSERPPKKHATDPPDEAIVTQGILSRLEEAALEAPEQYLWSVPIGTIQTRAPSTRSRLSRGAMEKREMNEGIMHVRLDMAPLAHRVPLAAAAD